MEQHTKNWIWIGILCIPTVIIATVVPVVLLLGTGNPGPNFTLAEGHYTLYSSIDIRNTATSDQEYSFMTPGPFDLLDGRVVSGGLTIEKISKKEFNRDGLESGKLPSNLKKTFYSLFFSFTFDSGDQSDYIPSFDEGSTTQGSRFSLEYTDHSSGLLETSRFSIDWHSSNQFIDDSLTIAPRDITYLNIEGLDLDSSPVGPVLDYEGVSYLLDSRRAMFILDEELEKLPYPPMTPIEE